MNTVDKLKSGHESVLQSVDAFPPAAVDVPGACGSWSVKDILAHLTSYEHVLVDVLNRFVGGSSTPDLDRLTELGDQFNDSEVTRYKGTSLADVLGEFNSTHARSVSLAMQIPPEAFSRTGTLPWYGAADALDDFLVQHAYGHKREHSAQIDAFRDLLSGDALQRQDTMTATTIKVSELFGEAINRRDLDAVMALIADDCVFENTSPPPDGERLEGRAAIRAFWENLFRGTRSVDFRTEDLLACADYCVARWTYHWANVADERGHIRGIDVIRVQDGKVTANYSYVKG